MIVLDWPQNALSPNARVHWAKKAKAAENAKNDAFYLAIQEPRNYEPPVVVDVRVCPPDKRRRDIDNVFASLKSAIDGISQAIGVDDQHFEYRLSWGDVVKRGRIEITLSGAGNE